LTVGYQNIGALKIYEKAGFFNLIPWRKIKETPIKLMMHL